MLLRVTCAACGEHGDVLAEEGSRLPRCPRCGQSFDVEPEPVARPLLENPAIDDAVASWLSEPPGAPAPQTAAVATCFSCGFEGLMQYDSERGDTICPACLTVYRMRPERGQQTVDCPNCHQPIEVHEKDRGKTIVCPNCNYFLGCVLRPEKRRYGARRILSSVLGAEKH